MKIGFVGCGNMATAIIGGILEKGILKKEDIKASTKTENSAKKVQETLGIECTTDNKKAVQDADVIFLAVKPQFCEEVIQEIKSEIKLIIISFKLFKSSNSYLLKSFYPHYTKKTRQSAVLLCLFNQFLHFFNTYDCRIVFSLVIFLFVAFFLDDFWFGIGYEAFVAKFLTNHVEFFLPFG